MKCEETDTGDKILMWMRIIGISLLLIPVSLVTIHGGVSYNNATEDVSAYVLINPEVVTAQWQYKQLRMAQCAWCGRTVNMNRHHVIPQAANPALRDVRENLVVLCRDCHFVLGHRCNWKQYNPDVLYICTHFTNCIKSADTRESVQKDTKFIYSNESGVVTDDIHENQKTALDRILKWDDSTKTNSTLMSVQN